MTDKLLPYYNRELSYIRRLSDQFVAEHSDAAGRLRMHPGGSDDPHVERLIEAFAYLTARVRRKLDDEFPELTDALLDVLYPHYLAPIPSAAIVQFELDRSQGELSTGYGIEKGTGIEINDSTGITCRYRTCYQTTLWPIEVVGCELQRRPFAAPANIPSTQNSLSVIRLRLRCVSDNMTFGQFDAEAFRALRLFLDGLDHHVLPLYELLLNDTLQIAIARSPSDNAAIPITPDQLRPVGFAEEHSLLPYGARSFPGYRLLTEYFSFPKKFHFIELGGIDARRLAQYGGDLEVYFYLKRMATDLEPAVTANTIRLGCTPIVNLFTKRAESIKMTQTVTEYPVIPDARKRLETEVYSVDRVTTASSGGETTEFSPLYKVRSGIGGHQGRACWCSHRRLAEEVAGNPVPGSEVFLSLVDLDLDMLAPAERTLIVETTCLNRDLPRHISRPNARLLDGGPCQTTCRFGPTATCRPTDRKRGMWSLISHLSLNQLSIGNAVGANDGEGAEALRRILELYNFADNEAIAKRISGIAAVHSKRIVGRSSDSPNGFCRGVDVRVVFDEDQFRDPGQGLYLFASVLESFLGLYCTINSFTQMTAVVKQGEKVIRRWAPNTGERALL